MAKVGSIHPAIAGTAAWQRAVREYIERLREHYRDRLAAVVLYGSRARGDADPESDADVLVVLKGEFDEPTEQRVVWNIAHEVDETHDYYLLGPIVATEHDYRRRMLPIFMNIRREGIELWPGKLPAVREKEEPYGENTSAEVALIRYLMREALDDAQAGLQQSRYRWAANRGYYAMFHAATALLLSEGSAFSRHRGVINGFSERYLKTGRFPLELGKMLSRAFDARNQADYNFRQPVTPEAAGEVVGSATAFVAEAERLLGS